MSRNLDPVMVEIVRNSLLNISKEMRLVVHRTAFSSTIQESQDFSAAIFEKSENALSFAHGISAHVGGLARAAKLVIEKFERESEELYDNDVIIFDDPYWGGSHIPDVTMLSVCRYKDVMFLPVVRGHWSDIGGMSPGSISGKATELFQEGLLLVPVKLYEKGVLNKALYETILANMRMPDQRAGDIFAFTSACKIASDRLKALCDKHGSTNVKFAIREMIDQTEARTRAAISTLTSGTYEFENYFDSDGITPEPYRVHLRCQVEKESIIVDFSGTSEQAKGPTNSPIGTTEAAVFNTLKSMIDPNWPINEGFFRPFRIVAPSGTIVNPNRPSATGSVWEVVYCISDALLGAMAGSVNFIIAPGLGSVDHTHIGGVHPKSGLRYIWYEAPRGGSGANDRADGQNFLASIILAGDSKDYSIERAEAEFPLMWEEYSLRTDSGGPGSFRGGLGVVRNVRCLDRNREVSTIWDRSRIPGFGLFGGVGGANQRVFIMKPDGTEEMFPILLGNKETMKPIDKNDVLCLNTVGGGGYGDPLARESVKVLKDVIDGYVSIKAARQFYGVVIVDLPQPKVDEEATRKQREKLKNSRVFCRAVKTNEQFIGRRRCVHLNRNLIERLEITKDEPVELLGNAFAPLRAWPVLDSESETEIGIDEVSMRITRVSEGELLLLRDPNELIKQMGQGS